MTNHDFFLSHLEGMEVVEKVIEDELGKATCYNCPSLNISYAEIVYNDEAGYAEAKSNETKEIHKRVYASANTPDHKSCLSQEVKCITDDLGLMEIVEIAHYDRFEPLTRTLVHMEARNPMTGFFKMVIEAENGSEEIADSLIKELFGVINLQKIKENKNFVITRDHYVSLLGGDLPED